MKTAAIAAFSVGPQIAADLIEITVEEAELMQKKLVCCECLKGECNICGYKD